MRPVLLVALLMAPILGMQGTALHAAPPDARKVAPPRPVARPAARRLSDIEQRRVLSHQALDAALDGELDNALEALGLFADLPHSAQPFWNEPQLGAALANVLRVASERTAEQRFELWKTWTLPDHDRKAVRILVGLTSPNTMPEAFRPLAFVNHAAARPGQPPVVIPEAISTADLLIDAARKARRLDELADSLKKLVADKVEGAEMLAALVALARGSEVEAAPFIRAQIAHFRPRSAVAGAALVPIPRENWLLARACIERGGELQLLGEQHLQQVIEYWRRLNHIYQLPILYHDLHQSQARRAAAEGLSHPDDPGLELWHPATHASAERRNWGEVSPWWVVHDGLLASLGGREFDMLYFDYPLIGNFDFSIEALDGDWNEGNVSYAGMILEAVHGVQVPWLYPVALPEWLQLPET
ncbi:MAG TPA: hypothetical protein VGH74_16085, partial [Planctomycetaceae bacterium]